MSAYRAAPTIVEVISLGFDGSVERRRYAPGDAGYDYWLRSALRSGEWDRAEERMASAWESAGHIGKLAIIWRRWYLGPDQYMATFLPKWWFDR